MSTTNAQTLIKAHMLFLEDYDTNEMIKKHIVKINILLIPRMLLINNMVIKRIQKFDI